MTFVPWPPGCALPGAAAPPGIRAGVRALYCADASNYRVVPDLVIVPADVEDLVAAVQLAAAAGAPVVLRGGRYVHRG